KAQTKLESIKMNKKMQMREAGHAYYILRERHKGTWTAWQDEHGLGTLRQSVQRAINVYLVAKADDTAMDRLSLTEMYEAAPKERNASKGSRKQSATKAKGKMKVDRDTWDSCVMKMCQKYHVTLTGTWKNQMKVVKALEELL